MKKVHISRLVLAGFKMVTALAYATIAVLEYMGRNYKSNASSVAPQIRAVSW